MLIPDQELADRRQRLRYTTPDSQTPWQAMFRANVAQFDQGMVLKEATEFQRVAAKSMPRHNH